MPAARHSTPAVPAPAVPAPAVPAPVAPAPALNAPAHGPKASGPRTEDGGHPPARTTRWLLAQLAVVASPMLVGFLAGVFVTSIGEHATWRFIGLRILDQGGGVFLVGIAAALPAILEIPVFGSSRRLLARLGLRMMYVWGALIAAVLALLVAMAPEAWMVTMLRALDGTSYALRYMAMVVIIGALLPSHLHALGQSLTWLVYAGVAPIVAESRRRSGLPAPGRSGTLRSGHADAAHGRHRGVAGPARPALRARHLGLGRGGRGGGTGPATTRVGLADRFFASPDGQLAAGRAARRCDLRPARPRVAVDHAAGD